MYSENQKNKFALLRAEGESFNTISHKLDVPVRILFSRAKDVSDDIFDLKIAAYESVADFLDASANKRIQSLIMDLKQIDKKNNDLGFSYISIPTLLKMIIISVNLMKCHIKIKN